jgi:hypothetical protein
MERARTATWRLQSLLASFEGRINFLCYITLVIGVFRREGKLVCFEDFLVRKEI